MFLGIINYPIEGLGYIKEILEEKGYKVVEKLATQLSENEEFEGLVIMGGPMGVYESDKYPYLKSEMTLIRKAVNEGKPVLGVCLGSQLLSASLGGSVKKGVFGEEIGVFKVKTVNDFVPLLGEEVEVFQWHGDTFTLPYGSKLLAYSEKYFQAFILGKALGLQFHVEVNSKIVESRVREYGGKKELAEVVREKEEEFRKVAEKIITYWLGRS
ncbi:MAG: type 1 glutamine amidotransferase [Sulfolobus sp.]|nr:type 1 glutamine amidotransferase [Sulfolobus sp.]